MVGKGRLRLGDHAHGIEVERTPEGWRVVVDGQEYRLPGSDLAVDAARALVCIGDLWQPYKVEEWAAGGSVANGAGLGTSRIRSPMSGRLVELRVQEGAAVDKGEVLFVIEAMKMRNEVRAPTAGVVRSVQAQSGETLDTERVVLEVEPS